MPFTKLDYCQYLLSSPVNYTITNLADHLEDVSHDCINRYLASEKLIPRLLWEIVQSRVVPSQEAYINSSCLLVTRPLTISATWSSFVLPSLSGSSDAVVYYPKLLGFRVDIYASFLNQFPEWHGVHFHAHCRLVSSIFLAYLLSRTVSSKIK